MLEALWPRGGWARAAQYVQHRLRRLPGSPETIARGIFAGVFTTFTPFYGLHFVIAAILATLMRGNILASLLATFFGNPLTYVPIGMISMQTGYWLLDLGARPLEHGSLGRKFLEAGRDLKDNVWAMFGGRKTDWHDLQVFFDEVFYPYMIGGIIPGLICGLVAYYLSVPLIRAYQNRRRRLLAKKSERRAKKAADVSGTGD